MKKLQRPSRCADLCSTGMACRASRPSNHTHRSPRSHLLPLSPQPNCNHNHNHNRNCDTQYLEWREKQYDVRALVDIHSKDGAIIVKDALCYIATDSPANVNWLGPAPLEAIAAQVECCNAVLRCRCMGVHGGAWVDRLTEHASPVTSPPSSPCNPPRINQIASSVGPSGPNCEYVYKLAAVMHGMGVDDEELFWLESEVRRLVADRAAGSQGLEEISSSSSVKQQHHYYQRHVQAIAVEAVARAEVPAAAAGLRSLEQD